MKVLFIHPPVREDDTPNNVPIGLGWIAAVMHNEGHEVEILDINAWRYTKEQVVAILRNKGKDFDMFGISGMITTYNYMKWLQNTLKQMYPDKLVIDGGAGPTSLPLVYLKNGADIVAVGEGELTMLDLVETVQNNGDFGNVEGIVWKQDDAIITNAPREPIQNLDELPLPAWELFPMEEIYLRNNILKRYNFSRSTNLLASRGCPFRCNFCHDGFGERTRWFSSDYMIDHIKYLMDKYKVEYIRFDDETFVGNRKRTIEFCQRLLDEKLEIKWGCTGRVNVMNEELMQLMKDAGCLDVNYGIESGSQKMLNSMQKDATIEQAEKSLALTRKIGITPIVSLMVGAPGENKETIREQVEFCKRNKLRVDHLFLTTPTPRTGLYTMLMQQGRIKDEEAYVEKMSTMGDFWANIMVNMSELSDEDLIKYRNKAEKGIHRHWLLSQWKQMPSLIAERYRTLGPKRFFKLLGFAIKKAI
ncbi:TPA: radical SAM protein [archaeon]|uniref:Radical SAM protein n=1 Tax=Candidatus Naiadarchaeum limnaeum TaxID=2756139 RepID=A0A832XIF5_9ARCH|nr:radical SAM protein [Candidatus Naiadarchaeum limnaeum]